MSEYLHFTPEKIIKLNKKLQKINIQIIYIPDKYSKLQITISMSLYQ